MLIKDTLSKNTSTQLLPILIHQNLCKKGWVLRVLLRNTEVLPLLSPFLNPNRHITGPLIKKLTHWILMRYMCFVFLKHPFWNSPFWLTTDEIRRYQVSKKDRFLPVQISLFDITTFNILTLPVPIPDEERKLGEIFILAILCGASKGFMKTLKAFMKPFEAPQKSVKIKIELCVLIMPHTPFRVNLHSIVARMSRNSLLETGTISGAKYSRMG